MEWIKKIERAVAAATPAPCGIHCAECEGEDHHWMPDCDEETGELMMFCKHCEASRVITDEDAELPGING